VPLRHGLLLFHGARFHVSRLSVCDLRNVSNAKLKLSAERITVAGREVRERHLVGAPDSCIQVMNSAGEPIRWKPFDDCIRVNERAINLLRSRAENTVKSDDS